MRFINIFTFKLDDVCLMKLLIFFILFCPFITFSQSVDFCIGSCAEFTGEAQDSIFYIVPNSKPDFFLWLGDNIYADESRWGDFKSMKMAYSDRHSTTSMEYFFDQIPLQYAIWDDHDYGPNDSDSSFVGRSVSGRAFEKVWTSTPLNFARYGDIRWKMRKGDAGFIGLDNRMHRGSKGTQILGTNQLKWLEEVLREYEDMRVVFIAIGSQVLNSARVYENYSRFPKERTKLLDICSGARPQVVFLTGDRHHGEINENIYKNKKFIEITSSPLTSSTHLPSKKELKRNVNLVDGSVVSANHFNRISLNENELLTEFINFKGDIVFRRKWNIDF